MNFGNLICFLRMIVLIGQKQSVRYHQIPHYTLIHLHENEELCLERSQQFLKLVLVQLQHKTLHHQ